MENTHKLSTKAPKTHTQPHELAKKLQSEIDHLLTNVDEKMLFSEFRENEIFDIHNGDKQEVVRYTLDDRIMRNRKNTRTATFDRLERTTTMAVEKITGIQRLVHYLFKPLQY